MFNIQDIIIANDVLGSDATPMQYMGLSPLVRSYDGNVRAGTNSYFAEDNINKLRRWLYTPSGLGIIGCENAYAGVYPPVEIVAQTCPGAGLDGWVQYDATATIFGPGEAQQPGTFDDLFVRVAGCDVVIGQRSGYALTNDCATTLAYDDILDGGPTTTVPEPGTLALLGTGLAGTLGVGSRSRRKWT